MLFRSYAGALGVPGLLQSYAFVSNPELSMPVTSVAAAGIESNFWKFHSNLGVSFNKIESQIYLAHSSDTLDNRTISPVNYDDEYSEIFGTTSASVGPFSGELSASYRQWRERYFDDGLEKGPAVIGFGRLSFLREFFIRRLYFGASVEVRASSRRDYRAFTDAFTDAFVAAFGRLEFRYKDFTFWLNDDNITNAEYSTWWPYNEAPRSVWWGFRWSFFD